MTTGEIQRAVTEAIASIAPEARLEDLAPGTPLREQLDLDSFDFLRLLVELAARLGVEVPEAEYGRLRTLDDIVRWFAERLGARG